MYSSEVKGAPQKPDLLLRSYMVGRVLLRPSPPTIQHIYTYQIKKSVQPTGYDALLFFQKISASQIRLMLFIVMTINKDEAKSDEVRDFFSYWTSRYNELVKT